MPAGRLGYVLASTHEESRRAKVRRPDDARRRIVTPLLLLVAQDWRSFFARLRCLRVWIVEGMLGRWRVGSCWADAWIHTEFPCRVRPLDYVCLSVQLAHESQYLLLMTKVILNRFEV